MNGPSWEIKFQRSSIKKWRRALIGWFWSIFFPWPDVGCNHLLIKHINLPKPSFLERQTKYSKIQKKNVFVQSVLYGVKLPKLQALWQGHGWILPLVKRIYFFLDPWLLVFQFIEIFNQMELTWNVSNFEKKIFI